MPLFSDIFNGSPMKIMIMGTFGDRHKVTMAKSIMY